MPAPAPAAPLAPAPVSEPRTPAPAPAGSARPANPPVPRDRDPAPARRGRIKVGASPWGEVSVDGQRLGRTPGSWELPAGAHDVEIVFPGADVPQRKVFPVTVKPGEEITLFAEFAP